MQRPNVLNKHLSSYSIHDLLNLGRRTGALIVVVSLLGIFVPATGQTAAGGGRMLDVKPTAKLNVNRMKDRAAGMVKERTRVTAPPRSTKRLRRDVERWKNRYRMVREKNGVLRQRIARIRDKDSTPDENDPNPTDPTTPEDPSECSIDPASPSIGSNIPATYFGPAPSTVNPSLIGPLQLLTAGQLDAVERTITLPLYRGITAETGENVWYIATDTTDERNAEGLGLNFSAKLAFADNDTRAVRKARLRRDGLLVFENGRVDFSPGRQVVAAPEPTPFPPSVFEPGAVGDSNYTPLVKITNAGGHVWNLTTIAFGNSAEEISFPDGDPDYSLVHDSVVSIDPENETVTLSLVSGFSFARPVLYLSLDANRKIAAALEGAIFAPALQDLEVGVDDSLFSAVERIFGFTNGERDCNNPQRQGFEAAVTDGQSPFNVLGGIPTVATDYSPMWDLNLGEWTQEAIDLGYRGRLTEEFQILGIANQGYITGPGGTEYGSSGIVINCPIVHRFL